ncbi:mitochondrial 30S ribosomal protein S12 [Laetiporus sulphureus 93-53]|uniref:Mitochondrial 30S ribosomal protein S12 n=1 Tax=Laetiporus sulphureus 93-53 TaxID=1314785 RepID=A0A165HQX5_9APHY|nr:mitochondrial 30S ribosomal protein S12 [Laetiporus sulphureus 93-53]KZT12065.1 mitochondrial 30S ribosomal protein S12 [Laetiporus sulphureus 93-53]
MLSALRALSRPLQRQSTFSLLQQNFYQNATLPSLSRFFHPSLPAAVTLNQSTRRKPPKKAKKPRSPLLEGNSQKKGVISSVFILKPKKPNSAKRKVARVKLTSGKTLQAYVPGEGHNLQEHGVVLVRGGRAQDLPGVRYKLVRGAYDFGPVVNRLTARSRYGAKKPKQ